MRKMKIDISFPTCRELHFFYLHVFVELLRAVIGHDVNAFEILNDFTVGMIHRGAHHVAAHGDFDFALGILNQNGAVERN